MVHFTDTDQSVQLHRLICICHAVLSVPLLLTYEPRCEKTGLRGVRPGPTQTGLYSHRRWLEA